MPIAQATNMDTVAFPTDSASHLPHLVDATMFWSAHGGGVRRYLLAKHAWLTRYAGWQHTIAAPVADQPGMAELPAVPLPKIGRAHV